ncbi:YSIRK-type signal peptide-containing protein [Staphylococcus haemolyticus]|nr:Ig-like domain-containing protein [Staphylococcus haemolyticus]TJX32148.1 YSIRK-type signal peptide-containing protein [Staphylococcus haemolyticus]
MSKRRQGPINKKVDFLSNKLNKYSIRKFTVGTASILVGATLLFGVGNQEAKAAENNTEDTSVQVSDDTSSQDDGVKQKSDVQTSEHTTNNSDFPEQTDITNENNTKEEPTQEDAKVETTKEEPTQEDAKVETTKEEPTQEDAKVETTKEEPTQEEAKVETTQEEPTQEDTKVEPTQEDTPSKNSQKSNDTQDIDTVVNDVQNATTTQDKQATLTNYIADTNNTSKEEAKAQVKDLDLDYNNLDTNTLLSLLVKDYSNKKESTTTYATARASESTAKPVNRLAAEATQEGSNVNNKINVNQFNFDSKTIDPNQHGYSKLNASFNIDGSVKSGDYFTINVPKNITLDGDIDYSNVNNTMHLPDLKNANGDTVATGTYDTQTKQVKYTFTNFVNNKKI